MQKKFIFTANKLRKLEPKRNRYFVYDGKQAGLRMYITPHGTKTFQFQQRSKKLNKIVSQTLGRFPALSIREAREQATALLVEVNAGSDIEQVKQNEKQRRLLDPTVKEFTNEYIEKYAKKKAKKTWPESQRSLNQNVIPIIGKLRMNEIKKRHIITVLDKIKERGSLVSCNRCHTLLNTFFSFAIKRDVIQQSPMKGIEEKEDEAPRERVLTEEEIKTLWKNLNDKSTVGIMIKFLLITGQRTGEARQMLFSEIDEDYIWNIPAEKTKNGQAHDVPLSPMAIEIIEEMKKRTKGPYVFPGKNINACLYRTSIPTYLKRLVKKLGWKERVTPHDLRRTMRSALPSLKIKRPVAEKILNHKPPKIVGVYEHYDYFDEVKDAFEKWDSCLSEIINGGTDRKAKSDNIIVFPRNKNHG